MSQQCKKSNSSKMEQIAKIFMNNQSLKKHEVNIKKKEIENQIEETPKNSLSMKYNDILYNNFHYSSSKDLENRIIKYKKHLKSNSTQQVNKNLNKLNSVNNTPNASLITENTSININNKIYEANKQKIYETGKLEEKFLSDSDIEEDEKNENIKKKSIESINDENLNQIENLYKEMIIEWKNIKINNDKFNESLLKKKVLAYDYIQFLFSEDIEIILNSNLNNFEINKFFLYQIYIFLSSIFNSNSKDEFIYRAFLNIFTYSKQNYEILMNNIKSKLSGFVDIKEQESFKRKNKIIRSIITTIPSNFPEYSLINKYYEREKKNGNEILKIISILKKNKNLLNTLELIEKEAMEKINNNPMYILPQINDKKYIITLFINLDEVLSFYCENNNSPYVKIRSGGEKFLLDLSKYFEIIIFTESSKEYMDTILDNLNFHNNVISYRLYSEYFDNTFISDISLLNRNPCKCIIINPNNILKCKNNEIYIKPFMGDEKDKILFKLKKILFQYLNNDIEDVRNSLTEIQKQLDN